MAIEKKSKAGAVKTFKCPACAGSIRLSAVGISTNAYCQSCGSDIDVRDENYDIINKAKRNTVNTGIPLGSRGRLNGVEWEAIGFQIKSDETGNYHWREYLLFNPYHGFRFLIENNGHWSLAKLIRKDVKNVAGRDTAEFEGRNYRVFLRGGSRVEYVMGEFYWQVKAGDFSKVQDYICPPYMLSAEYTGDEITWSLCEYVDYKIIEQSFGLEGKLPHPSGVAPNQPSTYQLKKKGALLVAFTAILFATIILCIAAIASKNTVLYASNVEFQPVHKGMELAGDIIIPGDIANVGSNLSSPVVNNWVELDMALVNMETNKRYDWRQSISYYTGYDSEGRWTEGSQTSKKILSTIPGGHYKLIISPDAGSFTAGLPTDVRIEIKRDVPSMYNYVTTILLIIIYPLYLVMRHWNFERRRWEESDYAPAIYRVESGEGSDD